MQTLFNLMCDSGIELQTFHAQVDDQWFKCLFSIRESPFTLSLIPANGKHLIQFDIFDDDGDLTFSPFISNTMRAALFKVMNWKVGEYPDEQVDAFLKKLVESAPFELSKEPSDQEVIRLRPDLGSPHRYKFSHWRPHKAGKPSRQNQLKTLLLLGKEKLRVSQFENASAVWT